MGNLQKYALLIGVGQRHDDESVLAITATDARSMHKELIDTCGFDRDNVELQTKEDTGGNRIIDQIQMLIDKTQSEKADLVVIFFSGHGCFINQKYYLIHYGTDRNNIPNTAIDGDSFIHKINQINTNKLILLLDCCHAGGFAEENKTLIPFDKNKFINNTNRVIITSSEKWEKSYTSEPVSVFTFALIEGLHGKDLREDRNAIRVFDLALYVRERTRALTKNLQNPGFNVLPQSFTENFEIVNYKNNKPSASAFDKAFKLYKDGKQIDLVKDYSEGIDQEFRDVWFRKLNIKEADIGLAKVEKMEVKVAEIESIRVRQIIAGNFEVEDTVRKEIIEGGIMPLRIRIEKDKIVYGWKKSIDGSIKDVETIVPYSDAHLHAEVSDFFIQWAKAIKQYDDNAENKFKILGKLLARFIDLDNQLTANLNLSETIPIESGKNIRISIMLEIRPEAGVLCQLPWEYLYIGEKDKEKITGKQTDYTKKYPSFFLAADKGMQFQFVRQTKRNRIRPIVEQKLSVVIFNNLVMDEAKLKERLNTVDFSENVELHIIPKEIFKDVDDFRKNYFNYINDMVEGNSISKNYILHYIGESKITDNELKMSLATDRADLDYMTATIFSDMFEQDEIEKYLNTSEDSKILPSLIILETDDSAKILENNNCVSLKLSYNDIPAVLGFQDKFPLAARVDLINLFYKYILAGMDVAQAVTLARQSLKFTDFPSEEEKRLYMFGIPVLFISTELPIKLLMKEEEVNDTKKNYINASASRKYCPRCGKNRLFANDKFVCERHRIRLEDIIDENSPELNSSSNAQDLASDKGRTSITHLNEQKPGQ